MKPTHCKCGVAITQPTIGGAVRLYCSPCAEKTKTKNAKSWYRAKRQKNSEWREENKRRAKKWRAANAAHIRKYRQMKEAA